MEHSRRFDGDETWNRLREWTKGQKPAERLASTLLQAEDYSVDPSHPLGGKDGGKDLICFKDNLKLVGAVYFPRGQKTLQAIKKKFSCDLKGVEKNGANGLVFITNQELKLNERNILINLDTSIVIELYHLERLVLLLNAPKNYGTRLEYLSIKFTDEEYLALLSYRDEEHFKRLQEINSNLDSLLHKIEKQTNDLIGYATGGGSIAYFLPIFTNSQKLELNLLNESDYPVFDINGYYIDLDEEIDPENKRFWTETYFALDNIYPNKMLLECIQFDLSQKEQLRLNFLIRTRTKLIRQELRVFCAGDYPVIAYRVRAGDEIIKSIISDQVPNYNPENPEIIFN
ncbi:hypothetical protein [uncultured Nostoc sp.]|uniref:hypothetical protein n=1 Tax=uncultured Nostoc sp. TaxID=340711 RepID=UPI00262B3F60|nr:hypothetical protein [uncultured Nostoc sp.]